MAEISKPDYRYVWSSGGANVLPSTTKIQTGWTSEVPPFQWENALQNRQDNMLVHINQHGIPQWDALTEYFANKSHTLGSDGLVYKAVQNSGPNTTTQDPVTDATDTYWKVAFASPADSMSVAFGDARYLKQASNGSDIPDAATFRTNIGAAPSVSPALTGTPTSITPSLNNNSTQIATTAFLFNQFTGLNKVLIASAGYQVLPSGLIIQWGSWVGGGTTGLPQAVTFPMTFPTGVLSIAAMAGSVSGALNAENTQWTDTITNSGFNGHVKTPLSTVRYIAIGY